MNGEAEQGSGADGASAGETAAEDGRIDIPPASSREARLSPDFGRRFVVFVDTEEEFDWDGPFRRENVSVAAMAELPEAQRFFAAAGVRPAYLCDYPTVEDDAAGEVVAGLHADGCEIGAQLHPWVNPPHDEEVTPRNSFTANLPVELQRAKLAALTERIAARTGERPTIHRAGRYGIGPHSAALLEEAGYRIDASVRALFDYSARHGPDFSRFGLAPFWAGPEGRLLELPLGAAYVGRLRWWGARLYPPGEAVPAWRALLARAGLVERIGLTPEGFPLGAALDAIRRLLDDGIALFSLSFHSPSVVPGHTPYVRDAEDLAAFYRWWDAVFGLFAREGVLPAQVRDVLAAAEAAR